MKYAFEKAGEEWIDPVIELIRKRVEWMDEAGIRQWNTTAYLSVYPRSCFEAYVRKGWLYVLKDEEGRLAAAAALFEHDARWPEKKDRAFYVHHLAGDPERRGAGSVFLKECEALARRMGKEYIRLDCDTENAFLNRYYESRGYTEEGRCTDGAYTGIRRSKKITLDF